MTTFHFSDQQLDSDLVTSISSLLDSVNVPNLLWGNYLLTVYGVPTVVDGVSFVVPDALIEISFSTLAEAGFRPCSRPYACPHSNSRQPPYKHLHIDDELAISLYRKSDVLWEFPEFEAALDHDDLNIMCASDVRLPPATLGRGRGRFPHFSFVRIPSASRYCEALILLLCWGYGTACETYWMAILTYMLEYVDGTDILDEENMRDGYKQFYHALKPLWFAITLFPVVTSRKSQLKWVCPKAQSVTISLRQHCSSNRLQARNRASFSIQPGKIRSMRFSVGFDRPIANVVKIVQTKADTLHLFFRDTREQCAAENGSWRFQVEIR
ncbi:predicted protein [Aspergillus nidulans FGSC A4]|uniref:Uncharacterized protein n=1 Tax=Emericella nidulans (strain FGSC A4 / ATCC 38163 / CBS 112.46 / NRRL 194 / M139) TaxID=227321 RepID=Q5BG50_EMENI|nr:hypothetical protein [Aspergillus nidulans FGSC A4]EAA66579.1 predicted protein [Aspergillus nidulans FGSC A4]CBF89403.1 TPA: conserved hypothetical protein [Aspergillus nidulans FGSC A4]|eukprot:XP_658084.1 predicted protein [Aspergillus nidulans FGSC A4]